MRPYSVFAGPFSFVSSCEKYENIVDFTVGVIVESGKIYLVVDKSASLGDHCHRILVVAVAVVLPVVAAVFRKGHNVADFECKGKMIFELLIEIVDRRAVSSVVAVSRLRKHAYERFPRIFFLELYVLELGKNHDSVFFNYIPAGFCHYASGGFGADQKILLFVPGCIFSFVSSQ